MIIVSKFGGTSIKDAERIEHALDIVAPRIKGGAIMVASAIDTTTDNTVRVLGYAGEGELSRALKIISEISGQHLAIASHLSYTTKHWRTCQEQIQKYIESLELGATKLAKLTSATERQAQRLEAYILSHGELLSNCIIHAFARARGWEAVLVDSRSMIITDSNYLAGIPDLDATFPLIRQRIKVRSGILYIVPGYISANHSGETTTLGRGGSDYTASLVGAALKADAIEIWTDVDGIMTTDPRAVSAARTVPIISYNEAAELAYFGARVIHPSTILPAMNKKIPLSVRNSSKSDTAGTLIQPHRRNPGGVCAIAIKNDISIVTLQSYRMLNAYGFLSRIFSVFEHHMIPVDIVTTSEVSVSVSIESRHKIAGAQTELEQFCNVEMARDYAIICLVGQGLWGDSLTLARTFRVLQRIPVRLISLGSSDTNLTLVVHHRDTRHALRLLHHEYFERTQ